MTKKEYQGLEVLTGWEAEEEEDEQGYVRIRDLIDAASNDQAEKVFAEIKKNDRMNRLLPHAAPRSE